nr:retrovirus-related Pol polyprotein from transposon TNT 1-94 [Tanacetum cinerariifolium]
MPHLCFLHKGIRLISTFSCAIWLSVCTLDRPIGKEGCASWDLGKRTWGGREMGVGTVLTMFMVNLSSEDPIYDKAGPSYDSDIPSKVQDHDNYSDSIYEHLDVHEMQNNIQQDYIADSDADYISDSNIIPYDQYVEDNIEHVVQMNVSSVHNDALKMIIDDMYEQGVQKVQSLKSQLKGKTKCVTVEPVKPKVLALGMYVIDVEPIPPHLKNNRDAYFDYLKHLKESIKTVHEIVEEVIHVVMWYLDSSCSKHIMRNLSKLKNFVSKFIGTVRFGNDHFGAIMGYGDYVISDSVISRVYYVEGLGHNLFSLRQFCDSDLEIAFKKHSYFVRDIEGVDLLKRSRSTNLYTIYVDEMMKSSPICLLLKASKNKSWLWHRRLNHLNFDTINDLARKDLVRGLPRLKFKKDHLCLACQLRKSKKCSYKPKSKNTKMEVLHTLHMDLYCPMRVQSINRKKYILVIVDDYSRFSWVKFLRSKDETSEFVTKFLTQIQVGLDKAVRYIDTDNRTEFVNQFITEFYERVGIFHQKSVPKTPQQNGVVERRNRTLVEAARTMIIFSKASIDGENLDKMKEKGDECIFVGYSTQSRAYRVFNKRTRVIMESIQVNFDELPQMASVQNSTDPGPTCQRKASVQISSDPALECQTMALEHNSLSPGLGLDKAVRYIDTDNRTEFVNQFITEFYERVGIFHQKSVPKTPQQNGVVERRNRTLVEAARTMIIFSKASMFL